MIYVLILLMLSGCASVPPQEDYLKDNTAETPCHGLEMPAGSCPYAAVMDMDGTPCHHEINCGGENVQ